MKLQSLQNLIRHVVMVATCVVTVVSCSETDLEIPLPGDGDEPDAGQIVIAVPELSKSVVATRVTIDETANPVDNPEGVSARWSEGDSFALWAVDSSGELVARHHKLSYLYPDEEEATNSKVFFIGSEYPKMEEGSYTYRAFAPYKDIDAEATTVSYEIPSVQSGKYDASLDIMRAISRDADRLLLNFQNDVNLAFKHETHMLRIVMPENPFENLEGKDGKIPKVGKIRIVFPQPVAGTLTFNAMSDDAPVFEGTSSDIIVDFGKEGIEAGTPFFVFIAPVDVTGSPVEFVAMDTEGSEVTRFSRSTAFGNLAAQVITPVNLRMAWSPSVEYTVSVIDHSYLGEPITAITTMTMPEGVRFADLYQSNVGRNIVSSYGDETFTVKVFKDGLDRLDDDDGNIDFVIESTHAENLIPYHKTVSSAGSEIIAPYLFIEDFNGADIGGSTGGANFSNNLWDLSNVNLQGWTGSNLETLSDNGDTCLRLRLYIGTTVGNTDNSWGRVDSPAMNLKEGTDVSLSVTYSIRGTEDSGRDLIQGNWSLYAKCYFGYHTRTGGIAGGKHNSPNRPDNAIDYRTSTSYEEKNHIITNCTKGTRLGWSIGYDNTGRPAAKNLYMYIDNIRVSISE